MDQFNVRLKDEISKYKTKIIQKFKDGQIRSIYPYLRKLANGPNDQKISSFTIPDQLERQLSPLQCVEEIASHFSAISQEFSPVCENNFPQYLTDYLNAIGNEIIPVLSEHQVYIKMQKAKKTVFC